MAVVEAGDSEGEGASVCEECLCESAVPGGGDGNDGGEGVGDEWAAGETPGTKVCPVDRGLSGRCPPLG